MRLYPDKIGPKQEIIGEYRMKFIIRTLIAALIVMTIAASSAVFAQKPPKAPDYSIAMIKVNAFDEAAGELSDANPEGGEVKSFFNDLSTSLFVWVAIQGEAGSFEPGRMVSVTVWEGKKIKMTRNNVQIGLIGEKGVYLVPVYVYGSLCDDVKITARITGQKTKPSKTVKIQFLCGE